MSTDWQSMTVYGIVALTALLLLRGSRRKKAACSSCPIHEISRHRGGAGEPKPRSSVQEAGTSGSPESDRIKGDNR